MKLFATLLLVVGSLIPSFGAPPPPVRYTDLTTNSVPRASGVLTNDGSGHVGWTTGFSGGAITITNLYSGTAFITNATIQNLYVTQQIISSNTVSGNIQGTVGMLPIFGPTQFDLADSGLHKTDTNTYVFDGTGDASVQLFGTAPQIVFGTGGTNILYRTASSLIYAVDGHDLLTVLPNGAWQTALRGSDNTGVFLTSNNLVPEVDDGTSLGGDGVSSWWHNLGLKGSEWISGFLSGTNYSRVEMKHAGTNSAIILDSQSAGTAGTPRDFQFDFNGTEGIGILDNGGNYGVSFGTGSTNILYRDGTDLVFTNKSSSSTVKLYVNDAWMGTDGTSGYFTGGSVNARLQRTDGIGVFVNTVGFQPTVDATTGLGYEQTSSTWDGGYVYSGNHPFIIGGFRDYPIATNYSRLEISHSGTNGAAILDSQSSGTAGPPRPIQIDHGGTNWWSFNPDGTAISWGITKAMKSALTPTNGMIVYQTDNTPGLRAYYGGAWHLLVDAADP